MQRSRLERRWGMDVTMPNTPPAGTGKSVPITEAELSDIFSVLANKRRRSILRYLNAGFGPVKTADIAEALAILEGNHTNEWINRVKTSLVHADLPRLAATGLINYLPEQQEVRLRSDAAHALDILSFGDAKMDHS